MASTKRPEKHIKFLIYFIIIVLLNVVGSTLFFRVDLTKNDIFSISEVSEDVVSTLSEPMTINVFFTKDLPAPHNNTNRYLQDLLKEYEISSNNYFNYKFYSISSSANENETSKKNKELAQSYGINPVQIRIVEQDEIKFKNAFMGIVLIHGDLIEKIPAITSVDGLEYKLTMAMKKLNNKISALLALKDKIQIELYLSSSLKQVAPFMRLNELPTLPDKIKEAVEKINLKNYGRLEYKYFDPSIDNNLSEIAQKYNIQSLQWNDMNNGIKAGEGGIGIVMKHMDKVIEIPVLNVIRIPIIGTQYELIDMDQLDEILNGGIDSLININEKIGYLADHGTLSRSGAAAPGMMMNQGGSELGNFNSLIGQNYTVKDVNIKDDGIASDINSLIIANPTEDFSDYELYQIDQALMAGKNLALFIDSFKEVQQPQQQFGMPQGPGFKPINTGLEKLLKHYGVTIEKSYVLDENCYKRPLPQQYGGGERKLYFVPQIESKYMNKDLKFMNNINGLLTVKVSPVSFDKEALSKAGIKAHTLFSSSDKSWEMKNNINLNPFAMRPPAEEDKMKSYALSCLLEGSFPSYFTGKDIPEKQVEAKEGETDKDKKDLSAITSKGGFISKSKPAKILIVTSSEMLKDNLLDEGGTSPNATFVMNAIDTVNGRDGIAVMRSKKQSYNPLDKVSPTAKMAVKTFNIAGLPVLVVFFGLLVWLKRRSRKNNIQMMFQK